MDNRIAPSRPQVVAATTAPRPTPRPARVKFADVLARGAGAVVQGAEAAMKSLPGAPLMAVAIRSIGGTSGALPVGGGLGGGGLGSLGGGVAGRAGASSATSAEGPGGATGATGATGTAGEGGGVESSLAQAQEMNMYYLQIQEAVNAQNRTFSALSNVMKAEHDTVKTAIGNIR